MQTGRLLKFQRPQGEIHAYLFREQSGAFGCVVYVFSGPGSAPAGEQPVHRAEGSSEAAVEASVRAWVENHYPRQP